MIYFAPRAVTAVGDADGPAQPASTALRSLADVPAYVLIGEPGAGKTTSFDQEVAATGGIRVPVREFLRPVDKPEWRGTTLFLDGLDEGRTGLADPRPVLDQIIAKLHGLDRPRFRLSCRWADWLGRNDRHHLGDAARDGNVVVVRLEPLSKTDIARILKDNYDLDPRAFVAHARERGLDRLLDNPQNLDMLAAAVASGEWPDSRADAFELACAALVTEPNEEHRIANAGQPDTAALLDVAGRLFAGQLIAGTPGYALPGPSGPTAQYPSPADLVGDAARTRLVLDSRLFVGASEGRLAPAHRQIAEFLAARHLARLIAEHHLSVRRVLALLVGFDGELLPSFRNLAAWLAVHSPPTRRRLAELHPSGLVHFADRDTFSPDEKRLLVANLRREADWNPWCLRSMRRTGLGPIVCRDVEDVVRRALADDDRGSAHQQYVMMLLQALVDGDPLPTLAPHAEDIVRDTTWREGVRCAALDVLVAYHGKGALGARALDSLLRDAADGGLEDQYDELLGILLKARYPSALTPDDVLRHLRRPKHTATPGEFDRFWVTHVPEQSNTDQAAMLLDRLAGNFGAYRQALLPTDDGLTRLHEFPIRLLGALLDRDDAEISTHRLLDWLTVCADTFPGLPESLSHHIDFRLGWRRGLLEELLPAAVEDCLARDDPERCLAAIDRRLFGARPFPYGTLCIERALAAANPLAVDFYLSELAACFAGGRHAAGTTVDRARAALSRRPELIDRFDRAMSEPDARHGSPNPPPDIPAQGDWQRRVEAWQSGPSAATAVLHSAAEAYLGVGDDNEGATPTERLRYLVGSRRDLADALLEGFRRTVRFDDLPTPRQVVRLAARGSIHHVSLPVLAALNDLAGSGQPALGELGDRALRLAVTLLYTFPPQMLTDDPPKPPRQYRPNWHASLLKDNPGLVADVLEACVLAKLGLAIEPAAELEPLVSDPDHAAVARLVVPRLLRAFPGLDTATACASLAWTLKAALLHADRAVLSNILAARLADSGTACGQRCLWLAAAFLLEPGRHRDELLDDTSDGLFDVVFSGRSPANLTRDMAPSDLELLVARLANGIARRGLPEPGDHTVSGLIGQLADAATPDATRSLASLASDVNLAPWLPVIDAARHGQARARREREFRHPDIHRIALTLDNRAPANPPDFKALLLDVLDDVVAAIEDGNANGRQTYWNVDPRTGKPREPRPENACRNSLTGLLEARTTPLGIRVDVQREATVVDDRRPDIRASYDGFALPFEIKRSCHPEVWSAIHDQLVPLYTREPATNGHGVYIVFWFGQTERCRPTPHEGWTPSTALELQARLNDLLTESQSRKIAIRVIDVSIPPASTSM